MTRTLLKPLPPLAPSAVSGYEARTVPRVGLILDSAYAYGRGITEGATSYAIAAGWRLQRHVTTLWSSEYERPKMSVDGVIAMVYSSTLADELRTWKVPVVNVAAYGESDFPSVLTDSDAIGRLAAAHFVERGFVHLASVYLPRMKMSLSYHEGFIRAVTEAGISQISTFNTPIPGLDNGATPADLVEGMTALKAWLLELPTPIGIFCSGDLCAASVISAAHEVVRHVPEEIAVLGLGDDPMIVNTTLPMLSSLQMPTFAIGYSAAQRLEQLMAGEAPPDKTQLLPPPGITVRASSDILAVDDRILVTALRFIRDNVASGLSVDDILRVVPLSRRPLERKFRMQLHRSILDEIHRARIERAKTLLISTDLSIASVATRSGFQTPTHLGAVFRQFTGVTPTHFKRQFGKVGSSS